MRNGARGSLGRKELHEKLAVIVFFLCGRRVDREAPGAGGEFRVAHPLFRKSFERVNPAVAHAVAELLLLPPHNLGGQQILKRLPQNPFFHALRPVLLHDRHFVLRIDPHRGVDEFLVQKRNAPLHTPRGQRFVGAEAVIQMQLAHLADKLLVKFPRVRRLVKIKIPAEQLVAALAGKNHLDSHRPDRAGKQIHGRGRADSRDVVGFDMINHVRQSVQSLLHGKMNLMMNRSDRGGHSTRRGKVGRAFQSHGKRMQARPPGLLCALALHAAGGEFLRDGRDDR